jgi:hypothetical protein
MNYIGRNHPLGKVRILAYIIAESPMIIEPERLDSRPLHFG